MFTIGQILFFISLIILLVAEVVVFVILILIFISGFISHIHGAPYVPIRKKLTKALLAFGELSQSDIFYDLGSGDGRVLITAARDFRVKKAIGYEIALWPYLKSNFLTKRLHLNNRVHIYRKDFFEGNLSTASFIYMYLFPKLADKLAFKIANECQPGTKVLCPSFPIDTTRHQEFRLLRNGKIGKITTYLYQKI
jgi:hypothetical protein